jgi:SAM-dependent methyltransferase
MASYESFAEVYDVFMNDTPYDEWVDYIEEICRKFNLKNGTGIFAELGCGTGNLTQRLAEKGHDMIGIDLSEQMLSKAKEKADEAGKNILYLCQDMREFELYGTVDCIVSVCDSINYITEEEDLLTVFKLVNNYLDPKGLFIFDINTLHKFRDVLADNSFGETTDNSAYTWENFFDEDEGINEFYTNFFIYDEESGKYDRFEEYHYEKAYTIEKIKELIEKSGMIFEAVYDECSFNSPDENSTRIFFVARENGK